MQIYLRLNSVFIYISSTSWNYEALEEVTSEVSGCSYENSLGDNIRNSNSGQTYMSAAQNEAPATWTNLITERANGLNGNLTAHWIQKKNKPVWPMYGA